MSIQAGTAATPSEAVGQNGQHSKPRGAALAALSLTALGIVYGDIGTSPLYAFKVALGASSGVTPLAVLGILSMIFWSLILIISIKYVAFVMRADNHGEGGILALAALLGPARNRVVVLSLGLFGAALLYGDGAITPAISVLSAIEGLNVGTHLFQPYVVPLTIVILIGLFAIQSHGTHKIGRWFGPIMLAWFLVIGIMGLVHVVKHPQVLAAVSPLNAFAFAYHSGWVAFAVAGAVFLVVTGGEALYADMGHVGRRPITIAWFGIVLPSLLLNYFGQGAMVLADSHTAANPFFAMGPSWSVVPLVILSGVATCIASQALISGVFSLTRQAISLGRLPRLRVVQTSGREFGQIYVPVVNWALMAATCLLVLGFKTSDDLAAAYGIAVSATMAITACLLFLAMRELWGWSLWRAGPISALFLATDSMFLAANLTKVAEGGWLPLAIGSVIFTIMLLWMRGNNAVLAKLAETAQPFPAFLAHLDYANIPRVPGTAIFMSKTHNAAPAVMTTYVDLSGTLHAQVIIISVDTQRVPRVHARDRLKIQSVGGGIWRVSASYGFMQVPDVHVLLRWLPRLANIDVDPYEAVYFLSNESVYRAEHSCMSQLGLVFYAFLRRNGAKASDYFGLPQSRIMEIGMHLEI
jgi:KUP system potassium uptake protein